MRTPWAAALVATVAVLQGGLSDAQSQEVVLSTMGFITWVSPRPDGLAAAGGGSGPAAVSADNRWVLFGSDAQNLVAGPNPEHEQVYLRDLKTSSTRRLSISPGGGPANGFSDPRDLSADGRWALFISEASDLTDDDQPGWDAFLADTASGAITQLPKGGQDGDVREATMDASGRYVAFAIFQLLRAPVRVMLFDRETGKSEEVLVVPNSAAERAATIDGVRLALSGDGRFLAYGSDAPLPTSEPALRTWIWDRETRVAQALPLPADILGMARTVPSDISADGRFVLMAGGSEVWDPNKETTAPRLYLFDRETEEYLAIPVPERPSGFENPVYDGVLSADGALVAFVAEVPNPYPDGPSETQDAVLFDVATGQSSQPLLTFLGHRLESGGLPLGFSPDGRFLLFGSDSNYIHPADHNGLFDAYLFELSGHPPSFPNRVVLPGIGWGEAPFIAD